MASQIVIKAGLISIAREFLMKVTSHLDPHTDEKGKIVTDGLTMTLLTPGHIQFAKYGRGPGKKPPLDAIERFVVKENLDFGTGTRGTAFAIQKSIGERGTKNFVPNAPNAMEEAILSEVLSYHRRNNIAVLAVENQLIQTEFRKIFPDRIVIEL